MCKRHRKCSVYQVLFNNLFTVSLKKKKPTQLHKNQLLKETPDFISFLLLTDHAMYFQRVHHFVVFFSWMFSQASYNLTQVKWQVLPCLSVPCRTDRRDCSWLVIALHNCRTSSSSGLASDLIWNWLSFWIRGLQNYTPFHAFSIPRHWQHFHWIAADVLTGRWGAVQLPLLQNSSFTNGRVWVLQDQCKNGESDENILF